MRVLAVDPGLMTGWAIYDDETESLFRHGQLSKQDFYAEFDPWPSAYGWFNTVVVERYTITPQTLKMSRQPDAIKITGVLELWCQRTWAEIVEQTPAEAKSFVTNDRLRKLSLYPSGMDHAADAMRHLVLYLVKEKVISASELV